MRSCAARRDGLQRRARDSSNLHQRERASSRTKERSVSLASEFKEFAMKGNVVDLAVGVIIGAAFGKIVSSLVGDIFMPAFGKVIGGINFSDLAIGLGKDPTGKDVLVKYGAFVQTIFDFVIIAIVLFFMIKFLNRLKKPHPADPPPAPARTEVLLEEIRDLLAKRA
jgi:large conductance mechanosensitive channel